MVSQLQMVSIVHITNKKNSAIILTMIVCCEEKQLVSHLPDFSDICF